MVLPFISLDSCTPSVGSPFGGTMVTLGGQGFDLGSTVTFDGIPAVSVIFVDPNTVICTTPTHASGLVDVSLTDTHARTVTLVNGFDYVEVGQLRGFAMIAGFTGSGDTGPTGP